jgi:hypothetical protein
MMRIATLSNIAHILPEILNGKIKPKFTIEKTTN